MNQNQVIIKSHEIHKYNELKAQSYVTSWVGDGFICLIKKPK